MNSLYHFCSTDPQFLRVVNWSLIGVTQRAVPSTFFSYVIHTNIQVFVAISGQLKTCKNCGSVEQKWYKLFTRPFFPSQYKRKKRSGNARLIDKRPATVWLCETNRGWGKGYACSDNATRGYIFALGNKWSSFVTADTDPPATDSVRKLTHPAVEYTFDFCFMSFLNY